MTSSAGPTAATTAFADRVSFRDVCSLFEGCTKVPGSQKKKRLMSAFFLRYQDDDYWPLMRLILPALDQTRPPYGLKESNLAKVLVEVLGISEQSRDGFRLLHWRRPERDEGQHGSGSSSSSSTSGDFGSTVALSLKGRCPERGSLTVASMNALLDDLAAAGKQKREKSAVVLRLVKAATADEMKWAVRIVLKELKIGVSEKSVLSAYHDDAVALFENTSDLRKVCSEIKRAPGADLALGAGHEQRRPASSLITLWNPVKPMLASRQNLDQVAEVLGGGQKYVLETKFDGERVQVHKDGDRVEMFSRKGLSCTGHYGEIVAPMIRECVLPAQCILDGELVVWDSVPGRFEDFGKLKTFAHNKDAPENAGKQLCYVVFDLLFVNGKAVTELSLEQRRALLQRAVRQKPHELELAEQRPVKAIADVSEALEQAVLNREEGVIVKCLTSPYVPNERKGKWIKLKPEYGNGIGDDLDLLIIGGFFGRGSRRGGTISHFLLGVSAPEPDIGKWYPVGKVGSGFSDSELMALQVQLRPHLREFSGADVPSWLVIGDLGAKDTPDVLIEPGRSKVLQVKAAQIVRSDSYRAGYTMRFPRVVRVRDDKGTSDAMSLEEVKAVFGAFQGRLATTGKLRDNQDKGKSRKRKRAEEGPDQGAGVPRRRIGAGPARILGIYRAADVSGVQQSSSCLAGKEICVMNGCAEKSKEDLERLVVECGGQRVQAPSAHTYCAVAGRSTFKVQNLVRQGACDVVLPSWLLDCAREKRLIPLLPKYVFFVTEATKQAVLQAFDPFGDSYTEDSTPSSLREAFQQVFRQLTPGDATPASQQSIVPAEASVPPDAGSSGFVQSSVDIAGIEKHYWPSGKKWWAMFRGYVVYLDCFAAPGDVGTLIPGSMLPQLANCLRYYGAEVVNQITSTTTHVVVDKRDRSRLRQILQQTALLSGPMTPRKRIVDREWVEDCMKLGDDLSEDGYEVR